MKKRVLAAAFAIGILAVLFTDCGTFDREPSGQEETVSTVPFSDLMPELDLSNVRDILKVTILVQEAERIIFIIFRARVGLLMTACFLACPTPFLWAPAFFRLQPAASIRTNNKRVGMALTLPDICGQVEYSNDSVGTRYRKWCKNYLYRGKKGGSVRQA